MGKRAKSLCPGTKRAENMQWYSWKWGDTLHILFGDCFSRSCYWATWQLQYISDKNIYPTPCSTIKNVRYVDIKVVRRKAFLPTRIPGYPGKKVKFTRAKMFQIYPPGNRTKLGPGPCIGCNFDRDKSRILLSSTTNRCGQHKWWAMEEKPKVFTYYTKR